MSDQPPGSITAGSDELPDVLRQLAAVLPQFDDADLESQLQTFDVFLGILAPSVRPQIAALLAEAASHAKSAPVRARLAAAAEAIAGGGRAAEPYDHAQAMRDYRQSFAAENPGAFDPIPDGPVEALPTFRYHPDPVATGSVVAADTECECCGQVRGFVYVGPVYGEDDYDECICPWCIADGSAHANLGASFTDEEGIGIPDPDNAIAPEVVDEVVFRTPGFIGWQQERWWTHCGDAAQFLGAAGKEALLAYGTEAIAAIRASGDFADDAAWQRFFDALDKEGSPTAYVFRCSTCGALGGYQDCD